MELENRFRRHTQLVAVLAGAAIVIAALGLLIHRDAERATTALTKPREETVDLSVVVNRIRDLNRLETASMRITHVGTISQSYALVPNALAGDELTLHAVGDVVAGVDLAQLQQGDVFREPNGTVVIRLPSPMILITRIDNRQTHVITRRTGIFRRADQQLEGRARQFAEQSVRNEAVRQGILLLAERNAEERIGALAHAMGARMVRFEERMQDKG
jgi:hypothetical protein